MNKKSNQILLLVLVGLVWAGVIYRFFDLSGDPETTYSVPNFIPPSQTEQSKNEYVYKLNYADPFLKFVGTNSNKATYFEESVVRPRPTTANESYPSFDYLGQVKFGSSQVGLIQVNGQTHMVKTGDKIVDDYKVIDFQSDWLKLQVQDSVWVLRFQ